MAHELLMTQNPNQALKISVRREIAAFRQQ